MYLDYIKTKWKNGNEYGEEAFNNIEDGIKNLETYAKYREKQTVNMGNAMKKLRTGKNVKIAVRMDSVGFGYNTINTGEEGLRRYPNDVQADQNMSEAARKDGYDGVFFYGKHPLVKLDNPPAGTKKSTELIGNGTVMRTEVQIPDVMIQSLNKVFGGNITYIDKVYTGDWAISSYYRYTEDNAADIEICGLGINDALGAFVGEEYRGNVEEFIHWYCKLIERALDAGCAWVIVTPVLQSVTDSHDESARTVVDIYSRILYDIAKLYGCPIFNGDEISRNMSNDLLIDFTHYVSGGNETIGKRMAAPFITGDLSFSSASIYDGSFVGIRPQEDSVNVYGNAAIEFSEKAPSYPLLLTGNDLYDTSVNRVPKGLAIFMNYPLDGVVKNLYDKTLLDEMELSQLNEILTSIWNKSTEVDNESAIASIVAAQEDYIFESINDTNVLWRQADLFAKSYGVRGSEAYKTAYNERISFLQGKHGYNNNETGSITWAFYTERDGMVVIPSIYGESGKVQVELDFATLVPEKNGYYLTLMDLDTLKEEATKNSVEFTSDDTKETLITKIKEKKGYNKSGYKQASPSDICEWLDTDEIDYTYVEPATCEINLNGYYNKRKVNNASDPVIKVVSKGWHTITISSKDNDKFLVFGLNFISLEHYKEIIK